MASGTAAREARTGGGAGGGLRQRPAGLALALVLGIALVQSLLVAMFAWPSARSAPHALPLVVAGPPAAVRAVEQGLGRAQPGAFTVTAVSGGDAARQALLDREAYGGIVVGASGVTVLTASAASPAVAQALAQAIPAAVGAAAPRLPVSVQDVAPNPTHDPHGVVPATALIPVVITGIVAGVLLTLLVPRPGVRAAAVGVLAVAGGLLTTLVAQQWLGGLEGSYWANAGVVALTVLAIGGAMAGLGAAARIPGVALGALVIFFVGYPISGATSAPSLVPPPLGAIGQALPPGAANSALRSVAFFDGARAGVPLLVLALWAVAGLALLLLAGLRSRRRPGQPGGVQPAQGL